MTKSKKSKEEIIPEGFQKCIKCGHIKPVDDFPPYYRNWKTNLRRMPDCWDCRYDAALSRMGQVKRNPVDSFVRSALNTAIKHGYIKKTGKCIHCKKEGNRKHHPNYRRPLLIEYHCNECHKSHHREDRINNKLNDHKPDHYKSKYLKRIGLRGRNYVPREGAEKLTPQPYRTSRQVYPHA